MKCRNFQVPDVLENVWTSLSLSLVFLGEKTGLDQMSENPQDSPVLRNVPPQDWKNWLAHQLSKLPIRNWKFSIFLQSNINMWHTQSLPRGCASSMRSYWCPTYSCQIPVIPVDFSAIPVEFTSQNFTPATEFCNPGIYTGTVPGMDWKGMALECSGQNEH